MNIQLNEPKSDTLTELVRKRQEWVRISKENTFDFESILAGLYSNPSHFIYELLQNAEDAGATRVEFELTHNNLLVRHNGRPFSLSDVDAITGIGISTKRDDVNAIGKFGVGFKSVFAVSNSPNIKSGEFQFSIKDFVVPEFEETFGFAKQTEISIPFNHQVRSANVVYELILSKLDNIDLKTLLFLTNVNEISWKSPATYVEYLKTVEEIESTKHVKKIQLIYQKESNAEFADYLVFQKTIIHNSKSLPIQIAFKLTTDNLGNIIIAAEPDTRLCVFFPTERVTYLNFLVQAPFKTNPNREDIPLNDEENISLINELSGLFAELFPILKKMNLISVDLINILPLSSKYCNDPIYNSLYEKTKDLLKSEAGYLPLHPSGFGSANDVLLPGVRDIADFLNSQDIENLFGKKHWLSTSITIDKTRELRDYVLHILGIQEIEYLDFVRKITSEFMATKSDEWVIELYNKLHERNALWRPAKAGASEGIARHKPIIRLENGEHSEPYDKNGRPIVYLSSPTSTSYKTVKRKIEQSEDARVFLESDLHLRAPDVIAEIQEFIIPKYANTKTVHNIVEYFEDFSKLLSAYKGNLNERRELLLEELRNIPIVLADKNGDFILIKSSNVYLRTEDLRTYFKDHKEILFVSDKLYQHFDNDLLNKFLLNLGCLRSFRRIPIPSKMDSSEILKLRRNNRCTYDSTPKDYSLDGIEEVLNKINPELSFLLWKMLIICLKDFNYWRKADFFCGEYHWKYRYDYTERFPAYFTTLLRNTAWILNKNNIFCRPEQISISEIADEYDQNDDEAEVLITALNFKKDEISEIEERTGGKFISKDEFEAFKIWKSQQKINNFEKEEGWNPQVLPVEVNTSIEEIELTELNTPDLRNQQALKSSTIDSSISDEIESISDTKSGIDDVNKKADQTNMKTDHSKDIGKWGEEFVFNALSNKFTNKGSFTQTTYGGTGVFETGENVELIWLNNEGDVGKGCDFILKINNSASEYIEVKTKVGTAEELIAITGTQWEFARKLEIEGEGEKYCIYLVANAGTSSATIQKLRNPIKLWKEGMLYAHPVNFKI